MTLNQLLKAINPTCRAKLSSLQEADCSSWALTALQDSGVQDLVQKNLLTAEHIKRIHTEQQCTTLRNRFIRRLLQDDSLTGDEVLSLSAEEVKVLDALQQQQRQGALNRCVIGARLPRLAAVTQGTPTAAAIASEASMPVASNDSGISHHAIAEPLVSQAPSSNTSNPVIEQILACANAWQSLANPALLSAMNTLLNLLPPHYLAINFTDDIIDIINSSLPRTLKGTLEFFADFYQKGGWMPHYHAVSSGLKALQSAHILDDSQTDAIKKQVITSLKALQVKDNMLSRIYDLAEKTNLKELQNLLAGENLSIGFSIGHYNAIMLLAAQGNIAAVEFLINNFGHHLRMDAITGYALSAFTDLVEQEVDKEIERCSCSNESLYAALYGHVLAGQPIQENRWFGDDDLPEDFRKESFLKIVYSLALHKNIPLFKAHLPYIEVFCTKFEIFLAQLGGYGEGGHLKQIQGSLASLGSLRKPTLVAIYKSIFNGLIQGQHTALIAQLVEQSAVDNDSQRDHLRTILNTLAECYLNNNNQRLVLIIAETLENWRESDQGNAKAVAESVKEIISGALCEASHSNPSPPSPSNGAVNATGNGMRLLTGAPAFAVLFHIPHSRNY